MPHRAISRASLLVVLPLIVLSACDKSVEVEGVAPRRGEIHESFTEPAQTRLARTHLIVTPVGGRISRIDLEPGDRIAKGQALATYDLTTFEQEAARARATVAELEAEIGVKDDNRLEETTLAEAKLTIDASKEALKAAHAQVDAEKARADWAAVELKRMEKLGAQNVSQSKLDDARLTAETALLDLRKQEFHRAAMNIFLVAMNLGPEFIERWIARKQLEKKTLIHRVAQAKASLALAEHELSLAKIVSPGDGVVLARYEQGDGPLPAGQKLLLLGNLAQLDVVADVLTQDALRLSPGARVSLRPASGLAEIAGKVERIEPAGFTKLSSLGVEQQRVRVIVSFVEPPKGLGVGFRVQARFFTGARPDALVVPRFSVLQDADQSFYVLKIVEGRLRRATVELGLQSDLELEVAQGLSEGDVIVRQPDATMKEGTPARVRNGAGKREP